ncbi:MAG: NAD(P)H-hydrate dehydratase [Sedimentisphaerales bacterium]|nr:NAD(P)H-hydrate dehydratase [Sedimentisphaerales bacterium]
MERITNVPRLKKRASDAHKGDFGKVLVIAGSAGMSGAAALVGKAALRSGSGLVRVAVPERILPIVAGLEPCYTMIPLAEDTKGYISGKAILAVLDATAENDVIAFGPGIGTTHGAAIVLDALLRQKELKLVVDADGLNNLAKMKDWPSKCKAKLIVTPHPGEMKRLWQSLFRTPLPLDRIDQAVTLSKKIGAVVVLKGAGTVVSDGSRVYVNTTGNPGMATAGSGDVLTGIITSLYGQGFDAFEAAILGVYTHGLAGDIAAKKCGQISLIATDIINALGEAFRAF